MKLHQPSRLFAIFCACLLLGQSLMAVAHVSAMFAADRAAEHSVYSEHAVLGSHSHVMAGACQADLSGWCALVCSVACVSPDFLGVHPRLTLDAMTNSLPSLLNPFIADPVPPPRYRV